MRTRSYGNRSNGEGRRRDGLHEKARLLFLRGDYFGAREIVEALLIADSADGRAKRLLKQIDEAEGGTGRAASWPAQTRKRHSDWRRRIADGARRCRRRAADWVAKGRRWAAGAAKQITEWYEAGVDQGRKCRRWLASGEWRKLELGRRFVGTMREFWAWLAGRPWRRVDWVGGIVRWLTEGEGLSRWELMSVGILSLILFINLLHLLPIGAQFGWMHPVLVRGKNGTSFQPVWLLVAYNAVPLTILFLYLTRGLLRHWRAQPE